MARYSPKPQRINSLETFGLICTPAPTSPIRDACSTIVTRWPACVRVCAAERPPSPHPTMTMCTGQDALRPPYSSATFNVSESEWICINIVLNTNRLNRELGELIHVRDVGRKCCRSADHFLMALSEGEYATIYYRRVISALKLYEFRECEEPCDDAWHKLSHVQLCGRWRRASWSSKLDIKT